MVIESWEWLSIVDQKWDPRIGDLVEISEIETGGRFVKITL